MKNKVNRIAKRILESDLNEAYGKDMEMFTDEPFPNYDLGSAFADEIIELVSDYSPDVFSEDFSGVDAIYYVEHNGEPAYYVSVATAVKGERNTMHGFIVTSIDYDGWGYPIPYDVIEATPNVPADAILVWDQDFPLS